MPVAIVTGASRGFGRAVATDLATDLGTLLGTGPGTGRWSLVLSARRPGPLAEVARDLEQRGARVTAVAGDIADPDHRSALVASAVSLGGVDLVLNNASELGPSPLPALADLPLGALQRLVEVNVVAPLGLVQLALPHLRRAGGTVVAVSSDAAVEAYPGWGAYGSSKAALDHLHRVLAVEEPGLRIYQFDPGDMRTDMHQAAFPDEDISDRPGPESVVPSLRRLLGSGSPSGRYRADQWVAA